MENTASTTHLWGIFKAKSNYIRRYYSLELMQYGKKKIDLSVAKLPSSYHCLIVDSCYFELIIKGECTPRVDFI